MTINKQNFEIALAKAKTTKSGLADVAGVSTATITKILAGNSSSPVTIGRIADALGVDVTEIIAKED